MTVNILTGYQDNSSATQQIIIVSKKPPSTTPNITTYSDMTKQAIKQQKEKSIPFYRYILDTYI